MRSKGVRMGSSGSVEGLPLQLLIAVVITGIVIAMVLGWMSSLEPPKSIRSVQITDGSEQIDTLEYDPEEGEVSPRRITVIVFDQGLNPLAGAVVVVQGCGVSEYEITNEDGEVRIDVSDTFLPNGGSPIGHLEILVEKSGYIRLTRTFPVVRV
ncbi:MAG: carboxypeptidase-like regulatory domain-containing protein [Thermoplasmata archaeon]